MTLTTSPPSSDTAPTSSARSAPTPATRAAPLPTTRATTWTPTRTGHAIAAIAVLAGLLATFATASPTGDRTIDVVLTFVAVAGITWLGAAAMRWDAALITLVAAVLSWSIIGTVIGVVGAVVGFVVPVKPGQRSVVNALLIGLALNIAARSELGVVLGASTVVFVALAAYVGGVGFLRRQRSSRVGVVVVVGTATALAFIGTFAFVVLGYLAVDDGRAAADHTRDGLESLGDGDITAARGSFEAAAASFDRADRRIDSPITAIARWVPGVSQHHRVATELTANGAEASRVLAAQLQQIDLDALGVTGGRIDLDRVGALQTPLREIGVQIEALQQTVAAVDSPWLLPPVAARLDELTSELTDQHQRSEDALDVVVTAPGLLGANEPRTYFVGFTTPSEARGIGGFMGNWAEVTVTDGQIAVTRFGRADDLNEAGDPVTRRVTPGAGLDEWVRRYGPYSIASGPGGTTGPAVWKNINMSPDMAATGQAIADLYPQSGGRQLDGVFMMDVYTLARLLRFTGPIDLPDAGVAGQGAAGPATITADNAADFLLNDQYDVTRTAERVDVLDEFSQAVVAALLGGTLPAPVELVDTLGPMVDQGRLTAWAARADEQALLQQIGMGGALAGSGSGDSVVIAFNNAVGNKIDYYLAADAEYAVTADAATNTADATLTLDLANNAPTDGEPNYVVGNLIGLPQAHNRTWVSIFTRLPVTDVRLDGLPVDIEVGAERGYFVTSVFVTLPPGGRATMTLDMAGRLDVAEGYDLSVHTPAAVAPTPTRITATWLAPDGTVERVEERRRDPGLSTLSVTDDR